jgi:hypothetical protein
VAAFRVNLPATLVGAAAGALAVVGAAISAAAMPPHRTREAGELRCATSAAAPATGGPSRLISCEAGLGPLAFAASIACATTLAGVSLCGIGRR